MAMASSAAGRQRGCSAPAFIAITGGSMGLETGGEHQEIELLMNNQGKQELINGHWILARKLLALDPPGESAGVGESTGWKAPVLSYAHSRGAYAGANLQDSKIDLDQDADHNLYGKGASIQSILPGQVQTPEARSSSGPRSSRLRANRLLNNILRKTGLVVQFASSCVLG
jgi:SH3 domain-containing YSC84-like protein 1